MSKSSFLLDSPDLLTQVVSHLKLEADVYANGNYSGKWAVDTSGSKRMPFHLINSGKARLVMPDKSAITLSSGDFILLPTDSKHKIEPLIADAPIEVRMTCGFFNVKNFNHNGMMKSLGDIVVVNLHKNSLLNRYWKSLEEELNAKLPAYYLAINHLAVLIFIAIIRDQVKEGVLKSGTLKALFDPKLSPVMRAIHEKPSIQWNIKALANIASMSRSGFIQRFTTQTNMSVFSYITYWRMEVAKVMLEETDDNIAAIALSVGYESDAAFRKAFKKNVGINASIYRKNRF